MMSTGLSETQSLDAFVPGRGIDQASLALASERDTRLEGLAHVGEGSGSQLFPASSRVGGVSLQVGVSTAGASAMLPTSTPLDKPLVHRTGVKRGSLDKGAGQPPIRRIKSTPNISMHNSVSTGSLNDGNFDVDCEIGDMDTLGEGKSKDQKAQRRLARKAEAARQSRRRKKAYVTSLEEKVLRLQAKVAELENRQKNGVSRVHPTK